MISRVVSQHVIKLHVIDLIVSLCLESLEYDLVFLGRDLELHVIEYGAEPRIGHEAALALVLILEEGLNQEALVSHEPPQALHARIKGFLFLRAQDMLRVENRRRIELNCLLKGVLLESLDSEDLLNGLVERDIVDLSGIPWYSEVLLEGLKLFVGEVDLLGVEHTAEFLGGDGTLAEGVVILEELVEADAVLLDLRLKLEDERVELLNTPEGVDLADVLSLLGCFISLGLEWVSVIDELHVLDLILIGAVDLHYSLEFLVLHGEA